MELTLERVLNFDVIIMKIFAVLACCCAVLSGAECTYRSNPSAFLDRESRAALAVHQRIAQATSGMPAGKSGRAVAASDYPPQNFIDEEIFGALAAANVPSAQLTGDGEFARRVSLDLTGRLPSPADLRSFINDTSTTKRDDLIDKLLASPAFVDKWTMWLGDLLENCSYPGLFDRREDGRNAYYFWMKDAIKTDMPFREIANQLLTATGNHYDTATGAANFPITGKTNMGPSQDTYDNSLVKSATFFLGMAQYDCLLCHDGRRHLDQINLWGSQRTRVEAQKMAAHFARLNMPNRNVPSGSFYYFSYDVSDRVSGTYDLNTNYGNRPERTVASGLKNLTPEYRGTAAAPKDGNWRAAFADSIWRDPMFSRNFANRFWRELFGMGLVEPYDMLDPDRLDPANPPDDPWQLQATHPVLLEKLAQAFSANDFHLRRFLKLMVQSNAYQMSSRYDAAWKFDYVPLFARHYPRRLMAEEIHDAIAASTGVFNNYAMTHVGAPVQFAMQLLEPAEPHSDGNTANFLNTFRRGNRDSQPRSEDLSVLQRLAIMNDSFVLNRMKVTVPGLFAIAKMTDNSAAAEEIYLLFLARMPSDAERQNAADYLASAKTATERNSFVEDLAWACVNKAEYLFSY